MTNNFWVLAVVIILIWGSLPIMLKSLTTRYPSHIIMLTTSIMFGVVATVIALYFYRDLIGHAKVFTKHDWMIMLYVVVAGSLISNMLYLYAIKIHDSTVVVTVTSIFPLVTLLLGMILWKQKYDKIAVMGVVLITIGVMCLTYAQSSQR